MKYEEKDAYKCNRRFMNYDKNHFFYNYFSIFIYIYTFVAWKILLQ